MDTAFPERLMSLLAAMNRKERYWLVTQAVARFQLRDDYRKLLCQAFDLEIPADAFVAMDYHLDWVATAIAFARTTSPVIGSRVPRVDHQANSPTDRLMVGNQEDIDLFVAFPDGLSVQLLMIEAKFDSGWQAPVMKHKAERLQQIFGKEGREQPQVQPHFLITSPSKPPNLMSASWPGWMRALAGAEGDPDATSRWFKLLGGLGVKPQRTDEQGRPRATGDWITLKKVGVPADVTPAK